MPTKIDLAFVGDRNYGKDMKTSYRIHCPARPELHGKIVTIPDMDPVTAAYDIAYEIEPSNGRRQYVPAFVVR